MAMKKVFVSDLDGKELTEAQAAKISVKVGKDVYVLDVNKNDSAVKELIAKGNKQAARGRKANGS